ncbi:MULTISPECIES: three-Cys-motif partner protein TcmP [unclassified Mesotoga]|uniref:three-Cys-motif partner protein TcmP n=1 Tax=unclassified Mesotoga TaxID=1184398 RepID=UPI000DA6AED7|nr:MULTISPECIES: three-Cys-motif partner protein TcmP [unclassified Mesotoga]PZC51940.1 hypothetical protein LH53_07980 [Mesotoga sp. TolDC]
MAKSWHPKEHSVIKETILEKYLRPWFMKTSSGFRHVFYFDTCSGPGVFKNGVIGSPIIALRKAHEIWKVHPKTKYHLVFCDIDSETIKTLETAIDELLCEFNDSFSDEVVIKCLNCDFVDDFQKILGHASSRSSASFFFIDPYSARTVPFITLVEATKKNSSEILFNFMLSDVNRNLRFWTSSDVQRIMGDERALDGIEDIEEISKIFSSNLKKQTGSLITRYSMVSSKKKSPLYDLFHLTKHCDGISIMKEVMSSLSKTPHYFSNDDRYSKDQLTIFMPGSNYSFAEVLRQLVDRQEMKVEEICDFIVCSDKFQWSKKDVRAHLKELLDNGQIEVTSGSKTINKNSIVRITEET